MASTGTGTGGLGAEAPGLVTGSLSVQLLRSCWQESSRSVWFRVSTAGCRVQQTTAIKVQGNTTMKMYIRHRKVQMEEKGRLC